VQDIEEGDELVVEIRDNIVLKPVTDPRRAPLIGYEEE